jgi:hypothetical protein
LGPHPDGDIIQHSVLALRRRGARAAEATNSLRDMPDARATFVSVDVCEVIGKCEASGRDEDVLCGTCPIGQ